MTGVWNWGYSEGSKSAALWGWFSEPGKPAHAWAKAVNACKASRVADKRVIYSGERMGGVCRVNTGTGGIGAFGEPKRRSKGSWRAQASKAGARTGEGRSVHDEAGESRVADACHKAQKVETSTDTSKVLIRQKS